VRLSRQLEAPMEEKLAAPVPPPRLNLVRCHGVPGPNAVDRAPIVRGLKTGPRRDRRRRP
jgi:hypothetical protein